MQFFMQVSTLWIGFEEMHQLLTYKRGSVHEGKGSTLFGIELDVANTACGERCGSEGSG